MNKISSICVYCASSSQIDAVYFTDAEKLGKLFANQKIRLINGAGKIGLMAAIANSVLKNGGEVTGIIPSFMVAQNWQHESLSELIEVENMHERKAYMTRLSDGVIALPGGCGTIEELMEVITWKQLGLYSKPIVILNTNGFYDKLIDFLQHTISENFMRSHHATLWSVASNPEEAIELLYTIPEWNTSHNKFEEMK